MMNKKIIYETKSERIKRTQEVVAKMGKVVLVSKDNNVTRYALTRIKSDNITEPELIELFLSDNRMLSEIAADAGVPSTYVAQMKHQLRSNDYRLNREKLNEILTKLYNRNG